ncbi:FtsX-like permease family protein [Agromyces mangrovi Wang et al. 2018]|uniref:FtsX-like permease family protein n=1 Tax=Agromyces mangrovi TaxID=1858653 RepID=UPI00257364FB|nr:FtsX-like permease family protein [Agromyces mangrovi]BDZ63421.1 hypothetical protein GCM10025877_03590 [Agromyces mangrovi]
MTTSPGIARLTRRRFATPRSAALVIVALTALVAFVVAAAPRALAGVIRDEVAYQVDQVAPTGRDLTGRMLVAPLPGAATDPAAVEGWDEGADAAFGAFGERLAEVVGGVDPALAPLLGEPGFAVYEVPIVAEPEELPATAPTGVVQLLADVRMRSELEVVEGEWPATYDGNGELEIVLARDAADTMAWPVGELRTMPGNLGPNDPPGEPVRLVGVVEAVDPDADRWQHLPNPLSAAIFDDGNRRPTATAAAYVDAAGWHDLPDRLHYQPQTTVWIPLDADAAAEQDPAELLAAMRGATAQSERMDSSGDARIRFDSTVVDVLATAVARSHAASAILTVAAVGPIAVSVALVVLAASLVVRRRRGDLALLAARGAPIGLLRRLLALEGLILGVPVAVVAAAVAVAVVPTDAGWLGTAIAALVGLVPAVALAGALRPVSLAPGRADLDAPVRGRARRIIEGAVLLVAAIAVTLLVVRGIGPSTGGVDPLVVAAPLLATVALALIVVRLHPLPIAAVLRRATRGRGVVALVGAARTLRDPAAGTTAVLAMLVAVAVAVFSSLVLATVDGGAQQAAERQVGADIRVSGPFFDPERTDAIRGIDGVEDAVGLLVGDRAPVDGPDGGAPAIVLATETERLAAVQADLDEGFRFVDLAPGDDTVQALASPSLVEAVGDGTITVAYTDVEVVGEIARIAGENTPADWLLVDAEDYRAVTALGYFPQVLLVDVADGADAAAVAAAVSETIAGPHAIERLDERTTRIQGSPAVTALRVALLLALGLAVVLSMIAVLLVAGVSRDARSRTIALLRTMGLDRRQSRGIVAWEFAPLGATALVGGTLLGAVLPLLVVAAVDLRPFTGGAVQPGIAVDPVLTGALVAAVAVALALAVVVGVVTARTTSIATVLRTEEDR